MVQGCQSSDLVCQGNVMEQRKDRHGQEKSSGITVKIIVKQKYVMIWEEAIFCSQGGKDISHLLINDYEILESLLKS